MNQIDARMTVELSFIHPLLHSSRGFKLWVLYEEELALNSDVTGTQKFLARCGLVGLFPSGGEDARKEDSVERLTGDVRQGLNGG